MRAPVALALEEHAPLAHHYDMGSTTECVINLLIVRRQTGRETQDDDPARVIARNASDKRFNTPRPGCDGEGLDNPFPNAAYILLENEDPPHADGELSIYTHAARGTCCDCHTYIPERCAAECPRCRKQCPCRDGRHAPHTYPQSPNFSLDAEIERAQAIDLRQTADPNLPHAQTHRRNTIVNFANIPTPATKTCSDCGEKFRSVGADTCAECRYYEDNPHLAPGYFRWTRATGRWIATAVWKTDMPVPKPGDTITVHRKDGDTSKQTVTEELPDRIDATGDRIVSLAVKTSQ